MTDYQEIVSAMQQLPGVSGVAIVNSAGQLQNSSIQNSAPELASVASQVFSNIAVQLKRMQRGVSQRLILETESGITLLSGLSSGELLIVFASVVDGFSLSQLLDTAARY